MGDIGKQITDLLDQGKNSGEIIRMGYKKGTVYGTQREWRKKKAEHSVDNGSRNLTPNVLPSATTSTDIESDPDVVRLKKEIRMAELENQLGGLKTTPDMGIIVAAAQEFGQEQQEECPHYKDNGICTFRVWSTKTEIPKAIGEPILDDGDKWRIKPHAIYCSMCAASLDLGVEYLDAELDDIPLRSIKKRFTCQCGTKGMVAVAIKCTKCGKDSWWGWFSKTD